MSVKSKVKSTAAGKITKRTHIGSRGVSVVDTLPSTEPTRKKRVLGTLKGKIQIIDPNWWKALADD